MFKFASWIRYACVLGLGVGFASEHAMFAMATEGLGPRDAVAAMELVRVQLFPAGQGVFEFDVALEGEHELKLWLTERERDDLLKTLVCSQLDSVRVSFPTESSMDIPAFARLAEDPSTTLAELIQGFRGQSIAISYQGDRVHGTLLGVEAGMQSKAVGEKVVQQSVELACLKTDDGLVRVPIDEHAIVSLESPELQARLDRILQCRQGKAADRLPVTLHIHKRHQGHSKFAFALETAPWKCAYRLVASENENELQASAIIDNTSGLDWKEVEVVLVVDQLLGFHTPLSHIADWGRDSMAIPAPFSAAPPMLKAGARRPDRNLLVDAPSPPQGMGGMGGMGGMSATGRMPYDEDTSEDTEAPEWRNPIPGQDRLGISFSAQDLRHASFGRRVHVSLPKVTLASGASATMFLPKLPQIVDDMRVYEERIHDGHPLSAFQLTLQDGYQLPGGPGAVWKRNGYAGDVMIPRLASGVPQLVTYAVDGLIEIKHERPTPDSETTLPSIWKRDDDAWLETVRLERVHHYRIRNEGEKSPTIFIEHRASDSNWIPQRNDASVEMPKATDYRYRVRSLAGQQMEFAVNERRSEEVRWTRQSDLASLRFKIRGQDLDPSVRQTMEQWVREIDEEQQYLRTRDQLTAKLNQVNQEQNRIKGLLSAVIRGEELHQRYLDKLNTLENENERLTEAIRSLQEQRDPKLLGASQARGNSSNGR